MFDNIPLVKAVRTAVLLTSFMLAGTVFVSAQSPTVRFYPYGNLVLCKGCGHAQTDYWRLKYRLENTSGKDLIVYARKIGDDIDFIHEVQYRNPHLCKWEYGHGDSERRVLWKDLSPDEKVKIYLKPGQSLESERGIGGYVWGGVNSTPVRYNTFVATDPDTEPFEIYSDPLVEIRDIDANGAIKPSYRIVDHSCTPQCALNNDNSPEVNGIRLGTSLPEFKKLFPKAKVSKLHEDLYNYKMASLWDFNSDAYSVGLSFLDDKVARIEVRFKSLKNARRRDDFYQQISQKIGIPFWTPYHQGWNCQNILIEVVPNEDPTIYIQTKEFIKARDAINEAELKKRR